MMDEKKHSDEVDTNNQEIFFTRNLNQVNSIIGEDQEFKECKDRIHERFDSQPDFVVALIKEGGFTIGFIIISTFKPKLEKWNNLFLQENWINSELDTESSAQFCYMYIKQNERGRGSGERAINTIFTNLYNKGIKKVYGFTRYVKPLSLYKRTGANILGDRKGKPGTYFFWDLAQREVAK